MDDGAEAVGDVVAGVTNMEARPGAVAFPAERCYLISEPQLLRLHIGYRLVARIKRDTLQNESHL